MHLQQTVLSLCSAYGGDEPPNIVWKFGDELLTNDSLKLVNIFESQTIQNGLVFTESILELCDVDFNDTGGYSCTASNSRGSDSYHFTLDVVPTGEPLMITVCIKRNLKFLQFVVHIIIIDYYAELLIILLLVYSIFPMCILLLQRFQELWIIQTLLDRWLWGILKIYLVRLLGNPCQHFSGTEIMSYSQISHYQRRMNLRAVISLNQYWRYVM